MTLSEKWSSIEPKIDDRIVKAIHDGFGFEYVMPVQKVVLPHFMQNHDVAVQVMSEIFHKLIMLASRLLLDQEKLFLL